MQSPAKCRTVGSPPSVKQARREARRAYKRDFDPKPLPLPDFNHTSPSPPHASDDLAKKLGFC